MENQNQNGEKEFQPPRHWVGVEELSPSYWTDPKAQEKRGQEFFEKPVEQIAKIDSEDKEGFARREFLTLMGASMALATAACARRPVHKIIPYVVKPEEIIPGNANYYASTSMATGSPEAVLVKTREGRPIKLEGNPDFPHDIANPHALSGKSQAALLSLYDPDRLKAPFARARDTGATRDLSWEQVDQELGPKLKGRVRVLSSPIHSPTTYKLVNEFISGFDSGQLIEYDALGMDDLAEAQALSYGTAVIPRYRFDQADVILSLGADFLSTWGSETENAGGWAKNRKIEDSKNASSVKLSKTYVVESTMTVTGGNADERLAVRPGDELKIALAVAKELGAPDPQGILSGYTAEAVAAEIGLAGGAEAIKRIARDLGAARGKSLVVAGGIHAKTKDAVALQIAANWLNSALGNEGQTVDASASLPVRGGANAVMKLIAEINSGQVDVLVIHRCNPAFTLPRSGIVEALKKVPLVIHVSTQEDETAKLADYCLPSHHDLESWGDYSLRRGVYTLQQPTIAPLHSTRAFQDTLLALKKAKGSAGAAGAGSEAGRVSKDWHDYLKANWRDSIRSEAGASGDFERFWETTLQRGVLVTRAPAQGAVPARAFVQSSLAKLPRYVAASPVEGFSLALYQSVALGDGVHTANNPWLQEMPDPISSITWDNYLNISPAKAKELNLATDDVVELSAGDVSVEIPVHVQPGMHPSVVSAAVGYGRRVSGKVGTGAGVDVYPFVRFERGTAVFAGLPVTIRKTGRFYRLAATQWHTVTENRPIINDLTLAEFKAKPSTSNHTDPHLRMETVPTMWPKYEFKGHRWGMAIDLNACTGCGACTVACQAENNIPVVGRDQVRNSRHMNWMRIDRYYSGSAENPEMVFQPMLCQHCENAPCETVCPVLATVHDDEGVNLQVYNRCVGTRYCQNNCPYKVRRFNFFDHWKSYETTMNLAWNPDITVRTRGIMEKCTFCLQRIRDAKDQAKDEVVRAGGLTSGQPRVKDGAFKTACQQTCATDAIIFGDMNDPESRVAKHMADQRAFTVLEVLNTKPSISYMSKVRNVERAAGHGHGEGGADGGEHHSESDGSSKAGAARSAASAAVLNGGGNG
jgi:molybdopterin-containing oxidoreductase family iron-sulfur binding subunit